LAATVSLRPSDTRPLEDLADDLFRLENLAGNGAGGAAAARPASPGAERYAN